MLDNYLLLDFLACLKFNLAGSASAAHNVYVASFGNGHALSLEVIEDFIGGLGGVGSDSIDRGGSVVKTHGGEHQAAGASGVGDAHAS